MASAKPKMSPVRRKQMMLLGGLVVGVILVATVIGALSTPKAPPPNPLAGQTTKKAFTAPGETVDSSNIWRAQEGTRVTALQQQMTQLQNKLQVMEKVAIDEKEKEKADLERKAKEEQEAKAAEREAKLRPAPVAPPAPSRPVAAGPSRGQDQAGAPPPIAGMNGQVAMAPVIERPRGIMRVDFGSKAGSPAGAAATTGAAGAPGGLAANTNSSDNYIPATTFARGVLLSGVDAPTGGQAQQNPHPLIIELLDPASLPNGVLADYVACRLTANAVGDLSSERAYIRLDRLACIADDGRAIDVAVKGFISDSSGKNGVRGRLVTKQGQILANALLAGVASGIGQAFQQSATTVSTSALGSTQTIQDGKQIQAGLGSGVNSAMQQLAKYYVTLAEKLFPIIEIDAGQPVDVVITQGVSIAQKR